MNNLYLADFGYTLPPMHEAMMHLLGGRLEALEHDYSNGDGFLIQFEFREHTLKFYIKQLDEVESVVGEAAFQLGSAISSSYLREEN